MASQQPKPANQYNQFQNNAEVLDNYSPYTNQPQVVVHPNSSVQTFSVEGNTMPWSWCHLVTAMISFFCCTIFGFIATVMSVLSYVDHKGRDYEQSRAKRSCSYGFGIAGIVIGSIGFVIVIIYVAVVGVAVADTLQAGQHDTNNYMNNAMNNFGNN